MWPGAGDFAWIHGSEQPLRGKSQVELRGWEERALDSRDGFAAGLAGIGLTSEDIEAALRVRDASAAEVSDAINSYWAAHPRRYFETPPAVEVEVEAVHAEAAQTAITRLRDWLTDRHLTAAGRESAPVHLPLFLLVAPKAAGASVAYTSTRKAGRRAAWSVTVAGNGLSGEASVSTTVTESFGANAGEAKLVFLPVNVVVEKLVSGSGRVITRVDFEALSRNKPVAAIMLLDDAAKPPAGPPEQTYELGGDTSGGIATYTYSYDQKVAPMLNVGFKAFGADISLKYGPTLEASLELTFKLPGGRDYVLLRPSDTDGILWDD